MTLDRLKFKLDDIVQVDCHISTYNDNGVKEVILDFEDIVRIDHIGQTEDTITVIVYNFRIKKQVRIDGSPRIKHIFDKNDLVSLIYG